MSTLIQFRLSGEDEQALLGAARAAGLRPADYVRHSAKLAANRPDTALDRIEQRLVALEAKLDELKATGQNVEQDIGPATLVKGLEVTDLITEMRREQRAGVNAFLLLLGGEPLTESQDGRTRSGNTS